MQVAGGGMMGTGAVGVMSLVVAFSPFVWMLGLVALGGQGIWAIRKLLDRPSRW
jgi:hypothetical protein